MLTELIIFAIVFIGLNTLVGLALTFGLFKLMINEKFMLWYMKKIYKISEAAVEAAYDEDDDL